MTRFSTDAILACARIGLVATLIALVGCSGTAATPTSTKTAEQTPTPALTLTATPTPAVTPLAAVPSSPGVTPSASVPIQAQPAVNAAVGDLATRVHAEAAAVGVVSVTNATWPDGALGCPKPGFAYSQIVRPGYRIVLIYGGRTYEYHSDRGSTVVDCSGP